MKWIKAEQYNSDIHGNNATIKTLSDVVFEASYSNNKWWTSYSDGGLRTCSPSEILIKDENRQKGSDENSSDVQ